MNVTYLLGAGASAGTNYLAREHISPVTERYIHLPVIPLVSQFTDSLTDFIEELRQQKEYSSDRKLLGDLLKKELLEEINKKSEGFIADLVMSASVDTLARKYYMKYGPDNEQLALLKFFVSAFLIHRQQKFGVDPRYDLFFAAIGQLDETGKMTLPDNVKMLSWNYDNQVELSFRGFFDNLSYSGAKKNLNIYPRPKVEKDESNAIDSSKFTVLKLNGSCDMFVDQNPYSNNSENISIHKNLEYNEVKMGLNFSKFSKQFMDRALMLYSEIVRERALNLSLLSFSWETNIQLDSVRKSIVDISVDTQVLVVIGYSFPTFNRNVDREIVQNLNNKKLEKVYIQCPVDDFEGVRSRFLALFENQEPQDKNVINVKQIDEFYIPYEMGYRKKKTTMKSRT